MYIVFWLCISLALFLVALNLACQAIEKWVVIPDWPEDEIGY